MSKIDTAFRPALPVRLFLRVYGIRISRDGRRVTVPRKRASMVDGIVDNVLAAGWRERKDVQVNRSGDVVHVDGPKASVEVRLV